MSEGGRAVVGSASLIRVYPEPSRLSTAPGNVVDRALDLPHSWPATASPS